MNPSAGLTLKPQHFAEAHASLTDDLWFEVHPENYMVAGGPRLAWLETIRRRHAISLRGVALSLAADAPLDAEHLRNLVALADRIEPALVSEHLAWSSWRGAYHPDLLPFPRSAAALDRIADNIDRAQSALRRRIAVENPSHYVRLDAHDYGEIEFLSELARRTGCGLLLDVNNVYVSACNLRFSAERYIDAFPGAQIMAHRRQGVLIVRPCGEVTNVDLDAAECAFLDACAAGENLACSAARTLATDDGCDLADIMMRLLQAGAFSAVD